MLTGELAKKKTTEPTVPTLVPQKHGGALNSGGTPGNSGGGTLTKNVRAAFAHDLETARQRIAEILADPDADPKDLIAIFDKLARYSIGEKREGVGMTPRLMNELGAVVSRFVTDEDQQNQIKDQWLEILRRHVNT